MGAVGGAVNAWLCYARVPVPAADNPNFTWVVVPAGTIHGGVLAATACAAAILMSSRPLWLRLTAAPPIGWVAGYVSFIPLARWAMDLPWSRSLTWPFHAGWTAAFSGPFACFGLVASLYFLVLTIGQVRSGPFAASLIPSVVAGVLGSLWWWIEWGPWWFSLLHGCVWGSLVGLGAWAAPATGKER